MSRFQMNTEAAARNHFDLINQHIRYSDRPDYAIAMIRHSLDILVSQCGTNHAYAVLHGFMGELTK